MACSVAGLVAVGCVSVAQAQSMRMTTGSGLPAVDQYGDPYPALSIPEGINTPIYVKAETYSVFCKGDVKSDGSVTMVSPLDVSGMKPTGWKVGGQLACGGDLAGEPVMINEVLDTDDSKGLTIGAASIYCVPAG